MRAAGELLASIPHTGSAIWTFGYRRADVPHPLDAFGFLVPKPERNAIMACTWVATKWLGRVPEGKAVLRCFSTDPDVTEEAMRADLQRLMGITAEPLFALQQPMAGVDAAVHGGACGAHRGTGSADGGDSRACIWLGTLITGSAFRTACAARSWRSRKQKKDKEIKRGRTHFPGSLANRNIDLRASGKCVCPFNLGGAGIIRLTAYP